MIDHNLKKFILEAFDLATVDQRRCRNDVGEVADYMLVSREKFIEQLDGRGLLALPTDSIATKRLIASAKNPPTEDQVARINAQRLADDVDKEFVGRVLGCVYPKGQKCSPGDKCQFPSRCNK